MMDFSEVPRHLQLGGLALEILGFGILAYEVGQAKKVSSLLIASQQSERDVFIEFMSKAAGTDTALANAFDGVSLLMHGAAADSKLASTYSDAAVQRRKLALDLEGFYQKLVAATASQATNIATINSRLENAWWWGLLVSLFGMVIQLTGITLSK